MYPILLVLLVLLFILAAIGLPWLHSSRRRRARGRNLIASVLRQFDRSNGIPCANQGETHKGGRITRKADAAIADRYRAVKIGSDADHIAVAGISDIPLGICADEPAAAEDLVPVYLLGSHGETMRGIASGTVTAGDFVVAAASGALRTLPVASGTYYIVGRALTTAATTEVFEFDPSLPIQRIVA
jgi:hypothetical protein